MVIEGADGPLVTSSASLLLDLLTAIHRLAANAPEVTLAAVALGFDGNAVLLLCPDEPTRALLTAWGIDEGFNYIAGSAVQLSRPPSGVQGFAGPLVLPQPQAAAIGALASFRDVTAVASGDATIAFPEAHWLAPEPGPAECRLAIVASLVPGGAFSVRPRCHGRCAPKPTVLS